MADKRGAAFSRKSRNAIIQGGWKRISRELTQMDANQRLIIRVNPRLFAAFLSTE